MSSLSSDALDLRNDAFSLEASVKERLDHLATLPGLIALDPVFGQAAKKHATPPEGAPDSASRKLRWTANPGLAAVNRNLLALKTELGVNMIFLLNREGYAIAASNSDTPESFIGTRYADRDYFIGAMGGKPTSQYAVGRKTNIPGIFFSAPVGDPANPGGVLVIKSDVSSLNPLLSPYDALLTDAHGVVIIASDPALIMHVAAGSAFDQLSDEAKLAQYRQVQISPLLMETLPPEPGLPALSHIGHKEHNNESTWAAEKTALMTELPQPYGNMTLHVMLPVNNALQIRQDRLPLTIVVLLAGYFVLFILERSIAFWQRLRSTARNAEQHSQTLATSLAEQERQLDTLVNHLPLMVVARDARSGLILRANPATQNVLQLTSPLEAGKSYGTQLTETLAAYLTRDDATARHSGHASPPREATIQLGQQLRVLRKQTVPVGTIRPTSGDPRAADTTANLLIDLVTDVTEQHRQREELSRMAFVDTLTNLPNRVAFQKQLTHSIADCKAHNRFNALLLIDLDSFKLLNDRFGHSAGDQLLSDLAQRLTTDLPPHHVAARLASDEFVLILALNCSTQDKAIVAATVYSQTLLARITEPYQLNGHNVHLTASLGVTLYGPGLADTADALLKQTDAAMYEAKRSHRGGVHFFDASVRDALDKRAELVDRLLGTLRSGGFEQHYQPQLDQNGRVVGVEALLRWTDSVLGSVSPTEFIPVAEALHIIVDIDRWVLHQACRTIAAWQNVPHLRDIVISVNVSGEFFSMDDFVEEIRTALSAHHAPHNRLMIELTEGTFISENVATLETLNRLRTLGITLSIDDFGTGNSSLSYMRRFAVDQLKIDQSFIRTMLTDTRSNAIVQFVIQLAKALGYTVLAEGVETEAQHQHLLALGCEEFQGFLFAPALATDDCSDFIQQRNTDLR